MAVSLRPRGSITQRLTRRSLVLLPRRMPVGWAACMAVLIAAQSVAAAAGWWYWQQRQASVRAQEQAHERSESATQRQLGELRRELEQSRLQQRLSVSRSQELERQIDALHRLLRESQEELGFLRQARVAKR
jgi:septal ring factor EnvC (AmiA/AmiB activator)